MLLGGAALTRTYVERDLREVYEGRLFYGKDAFEGLRVMDRLGEIKRDPSADDPDWGRVPIDSDRRAARPLRRPDAERRRPTSTCPPAPPRSRTDNPIFVPPFIGSRRSSRASPSTTSPATSTRPRCSATSGGSAPRTARTTRTFKDRIRPMLREQLAKARADGLLVPAGRLRLLARPTATATTSWSGPTSPATEELTRFWFPRPAEGAVPLHRRLLPARSSRGDVDYVAFHIVTMGAGRVRARPPSCSPPTSTRSTCCCTASASRWPRRSPSCWHRRIREEWGFADEDGPTLAGLFRQQYRGGRYSWGYPACPDLEDNERVAELLGADRIGIEVSEETGFQYQPEQTTSAIICHHPKAKYFVAR